MTLWPWLIFVTLVGACIGSFLNVVIYRLPLGQSIVHPPSACPTCKHRLAWYDNVPVLGWLWLRGQCRYCHQPISSQYPLIEAATASLFAGLFYILYMSPLRPDFSVPGLPATTIVFVVYLLLVASLIAATMIDAKLYIIPLEIPWLITAIAVVALPLAVMLQPLMVIRVPLPPQAGQWRADRLAEVAPAWRDVAAVRTAVMRDEAGPVIVTATPMVSTPAAAAAFGGAVGLLIANGLLRARWIKRSFEDDLPQPVTSTQTGEPALLTKAQTQDEPAAAPSDDPHAFLAHPHPRREVLKECAFLAFPAAGLAIGILMVSSGTVWADWLRVLGGVMTGYLAGGAVVWIVRILGTLGFGKEAMGLGDVHLMAAVGAVCGWQVAVLAFFVAPFFGILWAAGSIGLARLTRRQVRVIPYGPHLAAATLLVIALREPMLSYFAAVGL